MTGTQPVSSKYLFGTVILFRKAFPMVGLSICPQNKFVSTSNHYKGEWKYLSGKLKQQQKTYHKKT